MAWGGLYLALLACAVTVAESSSCTFAVPSTTDPSSCVQYDLSTVASQGPYKLSMDSDNQLLFSVCGDVNASSVPKQCSSASSAAAYQYNSGSCHRLGSGKDLSTYVVRQLVKDGVNLWSAMFIPSPTPPPPPTTTTHTHQFSVDPEASTMGIRMVYGDGGKSDGCLTHKFPNTLVSLQIMVLMLFGLELS